jgi:hypothetical protein
MKTFKLKDFTGGWFVGNFDPSILKTENVEVSVKHYKAGFADQPHIHKLAEEITVIISGNVNIDGVVYGANDILLIQPNEAINFVALTDLVTCVVKIPSIKGDKYFVDRSQHKP